MPNSYDYNIQEYQAYSGVGIINILKNSITILKSNFIIFFILALIAIIPQTAVEHLSQAASTSIMVPIIGIIAFIAPILINAAVTYAVYEVIMGDNPSLFAAINIAVKKIVTLLIISLIVGAVLAGIGAICGVIIKISGSPIIMIPTIIVAAYFVLKFVFSWAVAIPACVIEGLGPVEALKRSTSLTYGHKKSITALFLLLVIILVVLLLVIKFIAQFIPSNNAEIFLSFLSAFPITLAYIVTVVLYFDLRGVQEIFTIDDIANTFN